MMNIIIKNKKITKMKATSQFFQEFDLFQSPATLRTKGQKQMKNPSTGFFLFIISCFFVYIFIIGCVGILKYQTIDAQLLDLVLPQNDVVGYFNTLAIKVGNFTFQEINSMFAPEYVTVTIEQQYTDQYNLKWQPMVPCLPSHWIGLGQNYKETFYYYGIDKMLCLNLTQPARLNETQISWTCTFLLIKLFLCSDVKNISPNCNATKAINYLQSHNNIQMNLYLLDTGFFPIQKTPTKPFVNIDTKILISYLTTTNIQIQYAGYRIQTDQSLVSFTSNSILEGIWVSKIRNYARPYNYTDDNLDLTRITITMNQNMRVYQRTIGKLDNLISYVGGLFQMLMIFIAFFLLSFDQYRYELEVADGAFQYCKDGKQIKYSDMSFTTYIKYSIYQWTNTLLCTKLKWKLCNEIDQIREQIISLMEVNRFYKRIRNAQTAVTYALGEHKTDFIKLVEPPSIAKVNSRRLKIDYYDKVADHHVAYELTNKLILTEQSLMKENDINNAASLEKQKKTEYTGKGDAKPVQLSPQLFEIQKDFVNSLLALNPRRRALYEAKISPDILHRLKQKTKE